MVDRVSIPDEKQFIHHASYNKGYIMTPSMVENCIGLSNNAKTVYSNILNHVYEKGRPAFPSTYRLAIACDCSVNSVINYINELVEKGLIDKETDGRGHSNHYFIKECKDVPLLHVSEMMWSVMNTFTNLYGWKKVLSAKEHILRFMEKVGYELKDMETDESAKKELSNLFKHVLKGGKAEVGLLPKNLKFQVPLQDDKGTEKQIVRNETKETQQLNMKIDKNHWKMVDVKKWKVTHLKEYFYDKYLDVVGQPHPRNVKKHTGQMRRVLDNLGGDAALVKKYIDVSFEIGYDNMTLEYFSTSTRLGEIQTYLNTGKKPFYLREKREKQVDVIPEEQRVKSSSKELFDKVLGGNG